MLDLFPPADWFFLDFYFGLRVCILGKNRLSKLVAPNFFRFWSSFVLRLPPVVSAAGMSTDLTQSSAQAKCPPVPLHMRYGRAFS